MFDTHSTKVSPTTNLDIKAVSGCMVKNHPKSFFAVEKVGSSDFEALMGCEPTFTARGQRHKERKDSSPVVVLQAMILGDGKFMFEVVYEDDFVKEASDE